MTKNTTMKKVEIEIPEGKKAEWVNGVLTLVDDTPKDIKERVKTFNDAVNILGNNNQAVIDYFTISGVGCTGNILAFAKLRVIAAALNEGWEPTFDKDERRYYPYFSIYSKDNWDVANEAEKKEYSVLEFWDSNSIADSGLVCMFSGSVETDSSAYYGVRLAFKTEELAKYCGKQFIDIWADFLFV